MGKNFWPLFIIAAALSAAAIWTQTPRYVTVLPEGLRAAFRSYVRQAQGLGDLGEQVAAQGAAAATSDIPIVFAAVTDPVAAGLVGADGKPDRNCTGTSDAIAVDKIFDLANELTPGIKTYGFLYNLSETNSVSVIADAKAACDAANIAYIEATVTNSGEVTTAAQSLIGKVDAIFSPIDNTVAYAMPNLAQIANEAKLPVYVAADSMVADGGLATVGVNYTQLGKQTADMAVRILEGAAVADVPVEVLDEYATVVNEETAAAIGVDVSAYVK